MSRKSLGVAGVAVVVLGLVAAGALAQGSNAIRFESSFDFIVNGKEMPAGEYELQVQSQSGTGMLSLRSLKTRESTVVKPKTRLADLGLAEPQIVFDKSENKYYLSEVRFPGMDGYYIGGLSGEEIHVKVTGKK